MLLSQTNAFVLQHTVNSSCSLVFKAGMVAGAVFFGVPDNFAVCINKMTLFNLNKVVVAGNAAFAFHGGIEVLNQWPLRTTLTDAIFHTNECGIAGGTISIVYIPPVYG